MEKKKMLITHIDSSVIDSILHINVNAIAPDGLKYINQEITVYNNTDHVK